MKKSLRTTTSLFAIGFCAGLATAAQAQTAPASSQPVAGAKSGKDALSSEEVIVTASTKTKKKNRVSISVTDVKPSQIENLAPTSQAEVFRLIPGMIVNDTAGPSGNSNISVRGLPITTGGSPFVQLQEDGLPTVLFGDMNFGNNDYWERYDYSETVEAVRGGSASILASGAPGAVINYISQDGRKAGGVVAVTEGLNFNQSQVDFAYGGPITDTLRGHFDGFARIGDGNRNVSFTDEQGYQFKGNLTKDFDDHNGFIKVTFKRLDDREPNTTSYPALVGLSGNSITSSSAFPGFNILNQTNYSKYNRSWNYVDDQGHLAQASLVGIRPVATAIGLEFNRKIGEYVTLDDNFRYTNMSGTFGTTFMGIMPTSSIIGSAPNGYIGSALYPTAASAPKVGSIVYANGPRAGQAFTGPYVSTGPNIYVNMRDMGNIVNDFSANFSDPTPFGKFAAKGGVFYMEQTINQDWHVNPIYQDLSGSNPAMLDLYTGPHGTGQKLTVLGQAGYGNNWGTCCARNYELKAQDVAPYIDLNYSLEGLELDAGMRYDSVGVTGFSEGGVQTSTTVDGVTLPTDIPSATHTENPNYTVHYYSWSFGALYAVDSDISVFGRASRGGRANVDRNILSGYITPTGGLNTAGQAAATDIVYQDEVGVKTRGDVLGGYFGLNVTGFYNTFTAYSYDLTKNLYYDQAYEAKGIELESSYTWNDFSVNANVTYTDAKITKDLLSPDAGEPPAKTPKWVWLVAPSYDYGPFHIGGVFHGSSAVLASNPGNFYGQSLFFLDMFGKYDITPHLQIALHANNLLNTINITQPDQGSAAGAIGLGAAGGYSGVVTAAPYSGRTITATLSARF